MAPGRHRCHSLPGVSDRIIDLVLTEYAIATFATEHVDPSTDLRCGDATASGGEIRGTSPAVDGGIVHFRDGKIPLVVTI
jgi:hypothetical protein